MWFVRGAIPRDELDFVLDSPYNQSYDTFPDKIDVYLQPESYGMPTWRKLRNSKEIPPPPAIQYSTFRTKKMGDVAYNEVRILSLLIVNVFVLLFFVKESVTLCSSIIR